MFELQNRNDLEKHIDSFHVNQITKIFLVLFFSTEADIVKTAVMIFGVGNLYRKSDKDNM